MFYSVLEKAIPFAVLFLGAFLAVLILTPLVCKLNCRLGIVDKPSARRINTAPIPRGGGVALALGVMLSYAIFCSIVPTTRVQLAGKLAAISTFVVLLGYVDDKFSLSPKIKLFGQIIAALITYFWAQVSFSAIFPNIPSYLNCFITVFWFVGAINAFNLIDGIDGLASGLALIGTIAMAGTLFIMQNPSDAFFHFAFAGGLFAFLCYNYNPATVFLGDSGSMYIGYTLAALPLVVRAPHTLVVSIGIPMLAMGVPIFDSLLAIIRRLIRRMLCAVKNETSKDDVMVADLDHIHHRLLRRNGFNQRKTVWLLYSLTVVVLGMAFVAVTIQNLTNAFWLLILAVMSVVVVRNMASIELYDLSRLFGEIAHDHSTWRHRLARMKMPLLILADVLVLFAICFLFALDSLYELNTYQTCLRMLLEIGAIFISLVLFKAYSVCWARAMPTNFFTLFVACFAGSIGGSVLISLIPSIASTVGFLSGLKVLIFTFLGLSSVRVCRLIIRDLFYMLDAQRLSKMKNISRVLVYGSGLRFRSFRRELVRGAARNERMIVGLIDDDVLLRARIIGGIKVEGSIFDAPEVIKKLNVDTVVIACVVSDKKWKLIKEILEPTGVKISLFSFNETAIR